MSLSSVALTLSRLWKPAASGSSTQIVDRVERIRRTLAQLDAGELSHFDLEDYDLETRSSLVEAMCERIDISHMLSSRNLLPQDSLPIWKTRVPQFSTWNSKSAIRLGLKSSTWVFACIFKTALALSGAPIVTERQVGVDRWKFISNHPMHRLIEKPNDFQCFSDILRISYTHLALTGNALICKIRAAPGAPPHELWNMNPSNVEWVASTNAFIEHYLYLPGDGRKIKIPPSEVIHIMLPDPEEPRWGQSLVEAGAKAIDTDREAGKWQANTFKNSLIPPGVFSFHKGIKPRAIAAAKKKLLKDYFASVNAGAPLFLGGGATYTSLAVPMKDVAHLETRKASALEICAVLLTPGPIVGLEQPTYNNIETAERIWWQHTCVPMLDAMIKVFNLRLVPDFQADALTRRIRLRAVYSNIDALLPVISNRMSIVERACALGVPFNKANEKLQLGFDPIVGGDVGYHEASSTWLHEEPQMVDAEFEEVTDDGTAAAFDEFGAELERIKAMIEKGEQEEAAEVEISGADSD